MPKDRYCRAISGNPDQNLIEGFKPITPGIMVSRNLSISVFNGSWNAPIWSAMEQGYFRDNELDISIRYTASSTDLISGFDDGSYPLIFCSADNVLAYQENHAEITTQHATDAAIFLSGDSGFLYPVAATDIKEINDLKGKVIGVDKRDTGFAYVLYDILARHGIKLSEITIREMGSTEGRLGMVAGGQCQITLLRTPYQLAAQTQGLTVFNEYRMSLETYQGTVGVVHRNWLADNGQRLEAFKSAYRKGLDWFLGNPDSAKALLIKYLPQLSKELAELTFQELADKDYGLDRTMTPRISALQEVLRLRKLYEKALNGRDTAPLDVARLIL